MAYSSGGLVQATDYNALAGTIRAQWGVGSGAHGLGQSTSAVSDVAAASTVTATQWTGLIQTINSCLAHEGQAQISPSSVTQGNLITYYGAITTGANAAYNNTISTGLALTDSAAVSATTASAWGTTGNRGLLFTHNIAFASGDAARYFFNAGGRLKLSFAKSGGSATSRNAEWAALATALGSIQMTGNDYIKVGGSGTLSNLQHDGYYGATTSSVQKLLQYDGVGSYSSNYIASYVSVYGTPSNGFYPGIRFYTYWINAWANAFQDGVDGISTTNLVVAYPSTTYLANTWGTPSTSSSVALY